MHTFDYCERLDASFWAEPVNALSNIFFILLAFVAFRHLRRSKLAYNAFVSPFILIATLFIIGIGSFLWHTYATEWAELADIIPISIFMHLYLYLFARNVINTDLKKSLLILLLFIVTNYFFTRYLSHTVLNGSIAYLPALLFLLIMAVLIQKTPYLTTFLISIGIFFVSIVFRSIDFVVCDLVAVGTHSIWHLLNAILLYRLICLVIDAKADVLPESSFAKTHPL